MNLYSELELKPFYCAGTLVHGISVLHHWQIAVTEFALTTLDRLGEVFAPLLFDGLLGVVTGLVIVSMHAVYINLFKTQSSAV